AAVAVGVPRPGQEQGAVHQGLVAAAGDGQVDGDDAVLDLAQLAAVLPVHAGGLAALLPGAGLIDAADGAEVIAGRVAQGGGDVLLEDVAGPPPGPGVVLEELLDGADGAAGGQGDGLGGLARQVGQQAAAVDLQQVEGLGVVAAERELPEVGGESRSQRDDLLGGHDNNLRGLPEGSLRNNRSVYS